MSSDGSRASSAQSEKLPPVAASRDSPRSQHTASISSEDGNLNKFDPLPPIGRIQSAREHVELAKSNEVGLVSSRDAPAFYSNRHPSIVMGYRREVVEHDSFEDISQSPRVSVDVEVATMETQTEWSYLEDMDMIQKFKAGKQVGRRSADTTPRSEHDRSDDIGDWSDDEQITTKHTQLGPESTVESELQPLPKPSGEGRNMESEMTFASVDSSIPYPSRDDEYGVPILILSSDSEDSDGDDESDPVDKDEAAEEPSTLPSVGPPEIIKYQKETSKNNLPMVGPEDLNLTSEEIESIRRMGAGIEGGMFEGFCEFCGVNIKPFPTIDEQKYCPPEDLYCCHDYQEFVTFMVNHPIEAEQKSDHKIDIKPHPPHGSKQARKAAKEKAMQRMRDREMARQQQAMTATGGGGGGAGGTFYQFARQMKTINYALSSQKYMEEGWTLPPPIPPDERDLAPEVFEPEPMPPPWAECENKTARSRGLIQKFYPDGSLFVVLFADGTGTVYYPSGRPAITISSIERGLYTYIIQENSDKNVINGVFDPNGVASTQYNNGSLRLYMDAIGGIELDAHGARKRKWNWKDWRQHHVHAPPLQPITFSLTPLIGVRIASQEQQTLTFTCKQRSVRFQVGAKLRMIGKELPPRPGVEEDELYRAEISNRVQSLFNKVANLLKFPNSPKLHKLPSPLHLSSQADRLEKIREEQTAKKYSSVVTVN